jgi:hypothetical protein
MHPDPNIAVARIYQHEARRRAEVGRRAAEFKAPKHRRIQLRLPSFELNPPAPAIRTKVA